MYFFKKYFLNRIESRVTHRIRQVTTNNSMLVHGGKLFNIDIFNLGQKINEKADVRVTDASH